MVFLMIVDYFHAVRRPNIARHARTEARKEGLETRPLRWFIPNIQLVIPFFIVVVAFAIGMRMIMQKSRWDGVGQYGVLVVTDHPNQSAKSLAFLIVHGKENTATLMPLPDTLLVETLHGYGQYKVSSLLGLAELEKLPPAFVLQTLGFQFGVNIQDLIEVQPQRNQQSDPQSSQPMTPSTLQQMFAQSLVFRVPSSLSYFDRYRLWKFFASMRKNQLSIIDVLSSSLVKPVDQQPIDQQPIDQKPKGETLYAPDFLKLDALIHSLFADPDLRKEDKAIAVINTTGEARLATRVARALNLMGYDVVNIAQTSNAIGKTHLDLGQKELFSTKTVQTLQPFFSLETKEVTVSQQHALEYRADIVLFLGTDMTALLTQPIVQ